MRECSSTLVKLGRIKENGRYKLRVNELGPAPMISTAPQASVAAEQSAK